MQNALPLRLLHLQGPPELHILLPHNIGKDTSLLLEGFLPDLSQQPLTAAAPPGAVRVGLGESPGPRRQRLTPEHLNPSSGQDHRLPQPPSPVSIL